MGESTSPSLPLTRDQAVREMVELITGQPVESDAAAWKLLATLKIDQQKMRFFGWVGLTTLVALARRGDRKSAEALLNHAIGLPDKPFAEQVAALDAKETAQKLFELLLSMGIEEKKAWAAVERHAKGALALADSCE